jgi:hypothetical protein
MARYMSQPSGSSVAIDPTSASCRSGTSSAREPARLDDAERILPGVEARHLRDQRLVGAHADPLQHLAAVSSGRPRFFGLRGSIAGGMISTPASADRRARTRPS